ncbi:MAG: sensor domain-containing diguanylate cyclase [Thermodesulfobacteriota bacterium]|nr:sensor domain-containing diguanylate cyclase [Thermodesulfobacteriota bacterium]
MNIPDSVISRLEKNEIAAQKFHEIEAGIISILNFQDFFETLLTMVSQTFDVPHVWISIITESTMCHHLTNMKDSKALKSNTSFVSKKDFNKITEKNSTTILANKEIERFKPLFPSDSQFNIGSIALTPIFLDGETIGSLNQGDINSQRYAPGIDTQLLERLALKISICLSNVTAHEQLEYLAYHDPLTGLLNRRVMEKILKREFQRSKRYSTDLSVIFLDLDDFKSINDSYGHDQGDAALIHVAGILFNVKRDMDITARFAGDEFVIILPSTDQNNAEQYIKRVIDYLAKTPVKTNDSQFNINLSYGIASALEKKIDSAAGLLKKADKRLYQAKEKLKKIQAKS